MSYSDFKLEEIKTKFKPKIVEKSGLIESKPVILSNWLKETLRLNSPLAGAINTEKARSEFLIAPILSKLKEICPNISLFSVTEFNVDSALGLNGICDFVISKSGEQLIIEAPKQ